MRFLKVLLASLLILFSGIRAQSQVLKSIGLGTGWSSNFPEVREEYNGKPEKEEFKKRNLLYAEIQAEWFQHKHLSLLSNFSYISKGFEYDETSSGGGYGSLGNGGGGRTYTMDAPANYLTLYIAPKYSTKINDIDLYAFAGPYLGRLILVSQGSYFNYLVAYPKGNNEAYITEVILKPYVFGGAIGSGLEFKSPFNQVNVSVQTQYLHDFTEAANYFSPESDYWNHSYLFKMKTKTLLIGFGAHYILKTK